MIEQKDAGKSTRDTEKIKDTEKDGEEKHGFVKEMLKNIYTHHYKKLLFITILVTLLSITQIAYQFTSTGELFKKDVSIKGGLIITIPTENYADFNIKELANALKELYSYSIDVEEVRTGTEQIALVIKADSTDKSETDTLIQTLSEKTSINSKEFNIEMTGSSLGKSFFRDLLYAILMAFVFMGIVVFIYLRTPIPSIAVIVCAFSDMVGTLAVVNLMGMELSSAGIIGFLLLIGYSVDTDMLLTIRVLKRKEGTYMERIFDSLSTGMGMTLTTLAAVIVSLFVSKSAVITEIMTILLIGLIFDMFYTWIQNVAILRLFIEHKEKKEREAASNTRG